MRWAVEGRAIEQPNRKIIEQMEGELVMNVYMGANIYNLEERLIEFACAIVDIIGMIPKNIIGNHFPGQLIRSGSSPALNYAEAQDAESKNDFIHKMKIVLKELRETYVCLKIIDRKVLPNSPEVKKILVENNELICIFVKSVATARKKD